MKKTISINISGVVFSIDEDAYENLKSWLDAVSMQFNLEESKDEIIRDIESRISEIFRDLLTEENSVVTMEEVKKVIERMGVPEDFSTEEQPTEQKTEFKTNFKSRQGNKALFRDPDNRLLGGVCSGLGHYFGIDPIILRIILLISVFFYGTGTLIYIILWIVMQEAKTTSQKLEMRGERVDIKNIQRGIREEFVNVKSSFNNWSKSKSYNDTRKFVEALFFGLASVLKVFAKIIFIITGVFFVILGVTMVAALFISLFVGINLGETSPLSLTDISNMLSLTVSPVLAIIGLFLVIGIPFLFLIFVGLKIIFRFKAKSKILGFSGLGLWIVGIFISLYVGINIATNYKNISELQKSYTINSTGIKTIVLARNDKYDRDFDFADLDFFGMKLYKDDVSKKLFGVPIVSVSKSEDSLVHISIRYTANGKTKKEAAIYASEIVYNWIQNDSTIQFMPYFDLQKNSKFGRRNVNVDVQIPEGKKIYLSDNMDKIIFDIKNVEDMWDFDMLGKTWVMTQDGLSLFNKSEKNRIEEKNTKDKGQKLSYISNIF